MSVSSHIPFPSFHQLDIEMTTRRTRNYFKCSLTNSMFECDERLQWFTDQLSISDKLEIKWWRHPDNSLTVRGELDLVLQTWLNWFHQITPVCFKNTVMIDLFERWWNDPKGKQKETNFPVQNCFGVTIRIDVLALVLKHRAVFLDCNICNT